MTDRYLWTLPMFHANGWTFVWNVTAVGAAHVCLRKVDPAQVFEPIKRESVTMLCAAPTVLIGDRERARRMCAHGAPRGRPGRHRWRAACRRHDRARSRANSGGRSRTSTA